MLQARATISKQHFQFCVCFHPQLGVSKLIGQNPASRYRGYSRDNVSDDTTYEYYNSYNDYARSRRTPSPPKQYRQSRDAKGKDTNDVKQSRARSQSRTPSPCSDERHPRAFNSTGYSLHDSSDDSSEFGEIPERPASRGPDRPPSAGASTTASRSPTINSVKSPRAALNRFNTSIRRSPTPKSPELVHRYSTPRGRPPLPPGWVPQFSTSQNRWFYYNRATRESQWEAPGFEEKTLKSILRNKADGGGRIRTDGGVGGRDDCGDDGRKRYEGGRSNRDRYGRDYGYNHDYSYDHSYSETKYAKPRRKPHSLGSGLGTAGMILGVAGGIAAGTLLARALQSKKSRISMTESGVRRKKSQSSFTD